MREYFRPTFYGYKIHFFLFLGLSCNLRRTFVFVLRIMNVTRNCKGVWSPSYLSLLSTIISVAFCLVITVGNLMVVVVVVVDPLKKLRSLFNYFVVNLAVADLIVGTISFPIGIHYILQEYFGRRSNFRLYEKINHMSLFTSLTTSLLCLITLSIDRYIAIIHALKYRKHATWKKCWLASLVIWVLSLSLPYVYFKTGYIKFLIIYINTAVAIAAITLITTYIQIYSFLQNQTRKLKEIIRTTSNETKLLEIKRNYQQRRVTRVFLLIFVFFLACYTPGAIVIYVLQFCKKCTCDTIHIMRDVSYYLITINSCINPFVYVFNHKHYKNAACEILIRRRRQCLPRQELLLHGKQKELQ